MRRKDFIASLFALPIIGSSLLKVKEIPVLIPNEGAGLLIPIITNEQRKSISNPIDGQMFICREHGINATYIYHVDAWRKLSFN